MRSRCPFCNATEESFSVTNDGSGLILYKCHRSSCGVGGAWSVGADSPILATTPRSISAPPVPSAPSAEQLNQFATQYHLAPDDLQRLRPGYLDDKRRWWYPILGPTGNDEGGVARSLIGATPKSLTYKTNADYQLGSWYSPPVKGDVVSLLEDQVSAAKMGRYCTSVALLGCNLSDSLTAYLAKHYRQVNVMLDSDALSAAVKMADKLTSAGVREVNVVLLRKDVKNMNAEERELWQQGWSK